MIFKNTNKDCSNHSLKLQSFVIFYSRRIGTFGIETNSHLNTFPLNNKRLYCIQRARFANHVGIIRSYESNDPQITTEIDPLTLWVYWEREIRQGVWGTVSKSSLPNHTTFTAVIRRLRETGRFTARTADYGRNRFVRTADVEEEILARLGSKSRT
ncbi:hypothetical protein NQ318_006928 [Aromia moschata]|uniref:Uncharacterized protein n=1 Tax=Aromia moschata TaxID=1265417 RepID=A0AAV8YPG3_9CUCU|nr:hypothetical protein NQ318_006928 [Aromia moschata]